MRLKARESTSYNFLTTATVSLSGFQIQSRNNEEACGPIKITTKLSLSETPRMDLSAPTI
jgi:hypothetical protein